MALQGSFYFSLGRAPYSLVRPSAPTFSLSPWKHWPFTGWVHVSRTKAEKIVTKIAAVCFPWVLSVPIPRSSCPIICCFGRACSKPLSTDAPLGRIFTLLFRGIFAPSTWTHLLMDRCQCCPVPISFQIFTIITEVFLARQKALLTFSSLPIGAKFWPRKAMPPRAESLPAGQEHSFLFFMSQINSLGVNEFHWFSVFVHTNPPPSSDAQTFSSALFAPLG